MRSLAPTLLLGLSLLCTEAAADSCSCGYVVPPPPSAQLSETTSVPSNGQGMSTLTTATTASSAASKTSISSSGPLPINSLYFQESILSDFTRNDLDKGIWVAEEYHVPVDSTHGPHSREALVRNIVSNPLRDPSNASSGTEQGSGDAGLQLWVRSALDESSVSTAELNSVRRDITYGSFRIGMKVPALPGTCSAFFWYQNDTQEIDLNFLSSQMTASSHSVNLISTAGQSVNGAAEGSATPGFKMIPLMTNPSPGFHEYRFDWLPSGVGLFVDGAFITQISDPNVIPKTPGMLAVSHRSDCNPLSSGEPPAQDSVLTVSYIQAYFNTTTGAGASAAAKKDACPSNGQCVVANLNPKNATSSPMGLMAPVQPNAVNATGSSATGSGAQSSATAQGPAGSLAVDARFVVAMAMASVVGLCGFW